MRQNRITTCSFSCWKENLGKHAKANEAYEAHLRLTVVAHHFLRLGDYLKED